MVFPLAFNSQIALSLKRKASRGSEAAVKLSIVEQGTESEVLLRALLWRLLAFLPSPEHPRAVG